MNILLNMLVRHMLLLGRWSSMEFSQTIKIMRSKNSLTQQQLANELHVSRAAIAKWESGRGLPDIDNLIALSELYNISLDELIKGEDEVSSKLISDSKARRGHFLVVLYLLATICYVGFLYMSIGIFLIGFLIATCFVLFFEIKILFKTLGVLKK